MAVVFLGASAICLSVRPSEWNNSVPNGRIFMLFDFSQKSARKKSRRILLRMRNISGLHLHGKSKHILFSIPFFPKIVLFNRKYGNLSETFLISRRTERYMIKNLYWSSCKVTIILVQIEWNLIFCDIFEKYLNAKFYESPSSGSRVVPCGQTDRQTDRHKDRHDEANSRFLKFFERS